MLLLQCGSMDRKIVLCKYSMACEYARGSSPMLPAPATVAKRMGVGEYSKERHGIITR